MKTLMIVALLAGLCWTGVLKQNLVQVDTAALVEAPAKIKRQVEYLACYERAFQDRARTKERPEVAQFRCKLEAGVE